MLNAAVPASDYLTIPVDAPRVSDLDAGVNTRIGYHSVLP
jgi:hypothetical protein